jgi:hypothetical protein
MAAFMQTLMPMGELREGKHRSSHDVCRVFVSDSVVLGEFVHATVRILRLLPGDVLNRVAPEESRCAESGAV